MGASYWDNYWGNEEDDFTTASSWSWSSPKKKYKSSLGWGSRRLYDTASYYVPTYRYKDVIANTEELLRKAYKATRDMVVILDFPFDVDIHLSTATYIDNCKKKRIFIPTTILDQSSDKYDDSSKINTICGLGIHEAAHLKYTDARVLVEFAKKVDKGDGASSTKSLTEILANIIEDNRVEDSLLIERPGFSEFIEKAREYNKLNYLENLTSRSSTDVKFIKNLIALIRFPGLVDADFIKSYSEDYKRLQKLIYSETHSTKESCTQAMDIMNILTAIFYDKGWSLVDAACYFHKLQEEAYERVLSGKDGILFENPKDTKMSSRLGGDGLIEKLVTGKSEHGEDNNTYFTKIDQGQENRYLRDLKSVEKYIPGIRKAVKANDKNYDFNIYGCRHGLLDTTKLAEAYQGVPQVYIRQGHVTTNKTTVCVVIDESGSMGWDYKDETAKRAAILLNEALKDQPGVELYIYGHTADVNTYGSTEINVYREGKFFTPKYSLSKSHHRNENRDGTAIYEIAKRIRKRTQDHCLMFVLSDGEPAASDYCGDSAIRDVRKRVTEVQNMNFEVFQITIDTVSRADEMFDNVIDLTKDLSRLPKLLGEIIKKSIIKNKITDITT